jgi:hypothetical protein
VGGETVSNALEDVTRLYLHIGADGHKRRLRPSRRRRRRR